MARIKNWRRNYILLYHSKIRKIKETTMTNVKIEELTSEDIEELQILLNTAQPIAEIKSLVKEICDLPPNRAKIILCNMAKKAEEKTVHMSGWEKYILDSIKKHM